MTLSVNASNGLGLGASHRGFGTGVDGGGAVGKPGNEHRYDVCIFGSIKTCSAQRDVFHCCATVCYFICCELYRGVALSIAPHLSTLQS